MFMRLFAKETSPDEDSPCQKICALDMEARICRGCGRSPAEITGWRRMPFRDRKKVLGELTARLEILGG